MAGSDRNELRRIATRVLDSVLKDGQNLPQALSIHSKELKTPERAWLREVTAGLLRWQSRIDLILKKQSAKSPPRGFLHRYLSLAVYQILESQVPAEIVVSETIDAIKKFVGEPQSKFANALLRRINERKEDWRTHNPPAEVLKNDFPAWFNLPNEVFHSLVKTKGEEWTAHFARSSMERPTFWIRARTGTADLASWTESGPIDEAYKIWDLDSLATRPGYTEGKFFIQDISSQLLVQEVTSLISDGLIPKKEILDLCAAPGGKTMGLSWNGFQVTATDYNPKRLTKLKDNIARVAPETKLVSYEDALSRKDWPAIWIDAPCSGTGTLQKNPEIRHQLTKERLASLIKLQIELIQTALSSLKPGGHLVYSVCSVLPDECEAHIKTLSQPLKIWSFSPHLPPHGEGFSAFLFQKLS